eukprot:364615-Chlamydomonas_euryale.AAC.49
MTSVRIRRNSARTRQDRCGTRGHLSEGQLQLGCTESHTMHTGHRRRSQSNRQLRAIPKQKYYSRSTSGCVTERCANRPHGGASSHGAAFACCGVGCDLINGADTPAAPHWGRCAGMPCSWCVHAREWKLHALCPWHGHTRGSCMRMRRDKQEGHRRSKGGAPRGTLETAPPPVLRQSWPILANHTPSLRPPPRLGLKSTSHAVRRAFRLLLRSVGPCCPVTLSSWLMQGHAGTVTDGRNVLVAQDAPGWLFTAQDASAGKGQFAEWDPT